MCTKWNQFITQEPSLMLAISEYKRQCTEKLKAKPITCSRPPLRQILSNTKSARQTPSVPPLYSTPIYSTPVSLHSIPRSTKIRSCPNCNSPAKELNLRRASCLNPKCSFDFCKHCFKSWHEVNCLTSTSNDENHHELKRPSSVNIAGNARSKKRLKRL